MRACAICEGRSDRKGSYTHSDLGPLTRDEFSGGENTVQRKLEKLGFEVQVLPHKDHLAPATRPGYRRMRGIRGIRGFSATP